MIFKKFSRIFSFLWMTARTGCWKGFKVRPFARFARALGTKHCGRGRRKLSNAVFSNKYRTRLEHQFLTDHGVLHPRALYRDLIFELTLAPSLQADKHSAGVRNYPQQRAGQGSQATNVYSSAKAFPYDHIMREEATFAKKHGQ